MATSLPRSAPADRFYGTRAFAVLVFLILASVLLLSTWHRTEAGETEDPPPKPAIYHPIGV